MSSALAGGVLSTMPPGKSSLELFTHANSGPHPRPAESHTLGMGPALGTLRSLPGRSEELKERATDLSASPVCGSPRNLGKNVASASGDLGQILRFC